MYRRRHPAPAARRGVILLVVVILLTLFAIVGISFVLYAESEATASRLSRDALVLDRDDTDPDALFAYFMNQLIYDASSTDGHGVYSALRGHSLARLMYGWDSSNAGGNNVPFNGVGRLHYQYSAAGYPPSSVPATEDDFYYVNYTYFSSLVDGMAVRDPERFGPRVSPTASQTNNPYTGGFNVPYTYPDLNNMFLGWVDPNSGQVVLSSFHRDVAEQLPGQPLIPGFNHCNVAPPSNATLLNPPGNGQVWFRRFDPRNPNWYIPSQPFGPTTSMATYGPAPKGWQGAWPPTDSRLKYWVMRPRPVDQLFSTDTVPGGLWPPTSNPLRTYFPPPEEEGGDVKNLIGAPGGNDSVWLDLGAPVMVDPLGGLNAFGQPRKFKALFAPLILDLGGRINVNTAGNVRANFQNAGSTVHYSHQGWGPWEVNPGYALTGQGQPPAEWANLFLGNGLVSGRYGPDKQPGKAGSNAGTAPANVTAHFYAPFDFDGADEANGYGNSGKITAPTTNYCWPAYGNGFGSGSAAELQAHPGVYNYFNPRATDDHRFEWWDLDALLRVGDTGAPSMTSELYQLLSNTIQAHPGARRRITTHSFDLDVPGFSPWIWDPTDAANGNQGQYQVPAGQFQPQGNPMPFPNLSQRSTGLPLGSDFGSRTVYKKPGSYNAATDPQVDWRGTVPPPLPAPPNGVGSWLNSNFYTAPPSRIDLNRTLRPYPNPDPQSGRIDWTNNAIQTQFNNAQGDRQQLAQDIFQRLLQVTGTPDPNVVFASTPPAPPAGVLNAARWLAQLAVNMVDYIDSDDYMTPFNWYTYKDTSTNPATTKQYWVFGTELPRVVVNETYVERTGPAAGSTDRATYDVWVELLNPFNSDATLQNYGSDAQSLLMNQGPTFLNSAARLVMPGINAKLPAYSCYQLALTHHNNNLRTYQSNFVANVVEDAGDPDNFPPTFAMGQNTNFMTIWDQTNPTDTSAAIVDFTELLPQKTAPLAQGDAHLFVLPNNGQKTVGDPVNYSDPTKQNGYYVIGPKNPQTQLPGPPDKNGKPTTLSPTMASRFMSYRPRQLGTNRRPTVMLRRLACPNLPPNDPRYTGANPSYPAPNPNYNPALPLNPYITVDYQEDVAFQTVTPTGALTGSSMGRYQPYGAVLAQQIPQTPPGLIAFPAPPPSHSFFQQNSPAPPQNFYNWLVHLDRQLISPAELLHVSAYRPHELTQQFITGTANGTPNQQSAPWTNRKNRLYRALEFLRTANRAAGVGFGGRVPGQINVNALSDLQVFEALCDPQPGNSFQLNPDVTTMFNLKVMRSRTPAWSTWSGNWNGAGNPPAPTGFPYSSPFDPLNDKPFLPLSTGFSQGSTGTPPDVQYPAGISVENTLLRSDPTDPNPVLSQRRRLFDVFNTSTQNSAYLQKELFTKIFNNVTTRSNVFAVWVTVGFFEVYDTDPKTGAAVRPVKLGAEIGRAEGRNVRHRMFGIVDRSVLTHNPGPQAIFDPRNNSVGTEPPNSTTPAARVVPYFTIIQ